MKNSGLRLSYCIFAFALAALGLKQNAFATQTDIVGPAGSGSFGQSVTVLPNGNIVVVDPTYSSGNSSIGAVYLYDGGSLSLISTLTGSRLSDSVGSSGITVLANGNFVVRSASWDNPSPVVADVGAVTFCSAVTGCNGTVSASNSLIGASAGDQVGGWAVVPLTNGNYVVAAPSWTNTSTSASAAGAVAWCNGTTGTVGAVSSSNSLVGSTTSDTVGTSVTALPNGNYVVVSSNWSLSPTTSKVGAVTWGNGISGTSGLVSGSNSLIGSKTNDNVGNSGSRLTVLTNGNYVFVSPNLDSPGSAVTNIGATTWASGTGPTVGSISSTNSLLGSANGDQQNGFVAALPNGNFVVANPFWDLPGGTLDVGAATWGNGSTGVTGAISSTNSLVGSTAGDSVGANVIPLANGNYVVATTLWTDPVTNASRVGAVTWANGNAGITGMVSGSNSLVGSTAQDRVGDVVALPNGNYVVAAPSWDRSAAATDAGAVTWGDGASGTTGQVSETNSMVGNAGDIVGNRVYPLSNGNYVFRSTAWTGGFGAVTWATGSAASTGVVSSSNSIVGSTTGSQVGNGGVFPLSNGNYVVSSVSWDNGAAQDVGAATWANGSGPTSMVVSAANSLVGTSANDLVSSGGVIALNNGNYVVDSYQWDNGSIINVGAVTWGNGAVGAVGAVSSSNSLVGSTAGDNVGIGISTFPGVSTFPNGNYVVSSGNWFNPAGSVSTAGEATFGNGAAGTAGPVSSGVSGGNSIVGTLSNSISPPTIDHARNRMFVGRPRNNTLSILSFSTTANSNGDVASAGTWSNGLPNGLVNGVVPAGRTVTISSKMSIGQLYVQCGGSLTGGSASAYVIGSVRKDYCSATGEAFTYPLGDRVSYTPLSASGISGTGGLTASVTDDFLPASQYLAQATSLSRYWTLNGSGITANLAFSYTDGDINGSEAAYRLYKRNGTGVVTLVPSSVSTGTNTITASGVSQFSDWTAAQSLAPTAAKVSVEGRLLSPEGLGLRGALVTIVDSRGQAVTARTGSSGYFRFDDIQVGQAVVLSVNSRRYGYRPRVLIVSDATTGLELFPE